MNDREVRAFLSRLRTACRAKDIVFTDYAMERADDDLELGRERLIWEVIYEIEAGDYEGSIPSDHAPNDPLHVFITLYDDLEIYVKLAERQKMVIISLHRDDP